MTCCQKNPIDFPPGNHKTDVVHILAPCKYNHSWHKNKTPEGCCLSSNYNHLDLLQPIRFLSVWMIIKSFSKNKASLLKLLLEEDGTVFTKSKAYTYLEQFEAFCIVLLSALIGCAPKAACPFTVHIRNSILHVRERHPHCCRYWRGNKPLSHLKKMFLREDPGEHRPRQRAFVPGSCRVCFFFSVSHSNTGGCRLELACNLPGTACYK